jgi:hypothetical protein
VLLGVFAFLLAVLIARVQNAVARPGLAGSSSITPESDFIKKCATVEFRQAISDERAPLQFCWQ